MALKKVSKRCAPNLGRKLRQHRAVGIAVFEPAARLEAWLVGCEDRKQFSRRDLAIVSKSAAVGIARWANKAFVTTKVAIASHPPENPRTLNVFHGCSISTVLLPTSLSALATMQSWRIMSDEKRQTNRLMWSFREQTPQPCVLTFTAQTEQRSFSIVAYRRRVRTSLIQIFVIWVVFQGVQASAQTSSSDRKHTIPALLQREHVASVSFAQAQRDKQVQKGRKPSANETNDPYVEGWSRMSLVYGCSTCRRCNPAIQCPRRGPRAYGPHTCPWQRWPYAFGI